MSRSLIRILTIAIMPYLFTIAATYNGAMVPRFQMLSLAMMAVVLVGWLAIRTYQKWTWHETPLDRVFLLWGAAFGISLVANLQDARQISIGLWYVGLYIAIWYLLIDLLANDRIKRETLIDGVLIIGFIFVFFGYYLVLQQGYSPLGFFGLDRPLSLVGNPNTLATDLVVFVGFIMARFFSIKNRIGRGLLAFFGLATLFLLFLTFSRGGWVGMAAGLIVCGVLVLDSYGLLSPKSFREWFHRQRRSIQIVFVASILVTVAAAFIVAFIFIDSLDTKGRTLTLRTYLYDTAVQMFLEKPLTGHGLFMYGRGLERAVSENLNYPPRIHNQAHNTIAQIAAELGLPGLIAMGATIWVTLLTFRRNWQNRRDRALLIGAACAAVAFGVHHIFDVTSMLPAVAVMGIIVLVVALVPANPVPVRPFGYVVVVGLWGVLLVSAIWSATWNAQYVNIIASGTLNKNYTETADALQTVIDAEPYMPPYRLQQAFFYGLAAAEGDQNALRAGIESYRKVVEQLPNTAIMWANLGALLWQSGEQEQALQVMERASTLDQRQWQIALLWGQYAEAAGNVEMARTAYSRVILTPAAALHPVLQNSPIGRELTTNLELEGLPAAVLLYDQGRFEEAAQLWDSAPDETIAGYVVRALIAFELEGSKAAAQWMEKARTLGGENITSNEWVMFAQSKLAGQPQTPATVKPGLFTPDDVNGVFVSRMYFLRDMLPRVFVPQIGYSNMSPMLLRLQD